jgi:hypothetical protein
VQAEMTDPGFRVLGEYPNAEGHDWSTEMLNGIFSGGPIPSHLYADCRCSNLTIKTTISSSLIA